MPHRMTMHTGLPYVHAHLSITWGPYRASLGHLTQRPHMEHVQRLRQRPKRRHGVTFQDRTQQGSMAQLPYRPHPANLPLSHDHSAQSSHKDQIRGPTKSDLQSTDTDISPRDLTQASESSRTSRSFRDLLRVHSRRQYTQHSHSDTGPHRSSSQGGLALPHSDCKHV